jgi:hypothetical protein
MDEMTQQILAVLARPSGIGLFSRTVDIPGKGRRRHWYSLASGLASLQGKIEYRTRFKAVPDWVERCHPDYQIWLCRLALRANRALPSTPPVGSAADTGTDIAA